MTQELLYDGLGLLLLLVISAYFSAAETAMTAVSRARIYQLVMDGNKAAVIVSRLRERKEATIGTVLLGYNAVNIAASVLATTVSIQYFGEGEALFLTTVVMTLLVVIFTEVLPKTYALHRAETLALRLGPSLSICVKLLSPITKTIEAIIRGLFKLLGVDITRDHGLISATDVIRGTIELHHQEGQVVKQERDMLGSILDLKEVAVGEIMLHRTQVETLDADLPVPELVKRAVGLLHSRIPLWRGEPDNIIGLLHVKSLVKLLSEQGDNTGASLPIEAIIAICIKPWFIPETTHLHEQLLAFRSQRQHFAFVVDEYGAWRGIVTLEDIIEEIVGDIEDEHDEVEHDIQKLGDETYYVRGSVSLRDLNRQLDWDFEDEKAATVAGLVLHEAEAIPLVGDHYHIGGFRFTVVAKDGRKITRLRLDKLPDVGDEGASE